MNRPYFRADDRPKTCPGGVILVDPDGTDLII